MNGQKQSVGEQALAVQSGRDTNISGITPAQMKEILDALAAQLPAYVSVAREIVNDRMAAFEKRVLERFEKVEAADRLAFGDPDFHYALTRAQHAYARSGDSAILDTLVDLIAERAREKKRTRLAMTLNSALDTVAELTENEFAELSLSFLLRYTFNQGVITLADFGNYFKHYVQPFLPFISTEASSYQYLESKQCASVGIGQVLIRDACTSAYPGAFNSGFTLEELHDAMPAESKNALDNCPLLIPCNNDPLKLQFRAVNGEMLSALLTTLGASPAVAKAASDLFQGKAWPHAEFYKRIPAVVPEFGRLKAVWDDTQLKNLSLTSLGIALAYSNVKRVIPTWTADLAIWIK